MGRWVLWKLYEGAVCVVPGKKSPKSKPESRDACGKSVCEDEEVVFVQVRAGMCVCVCV